MEGERKRNFPDPPPLFFFVSRGFQKTPSSGAECWVKGCLWKWVRKRVGNLCSIALGQQCWVVLPFGSFVLLRHVMKKGRQQLARQKSWEKLALKILPPLPPSPPTPDQTFLRWILSSLCFGLGSCCVDTLQRNVAS